MTWSAMWFCPGTPQPKGSTRALILGGRPTVVPANSGKQRQWGKLLEASALQHKPPQPLEGAVTVDRTFVLPRPASATRRHPSVKPDVDKLTRALFDALTRSGVVVDDSRIVGGKEWKQYETADQRPGVWICVTALEEQAWEGPQQQDLI